MLLRSGLLWGLQQSLSAELPNVKINEYFPNYCWVPVKYSTGTSSSIRWVHFDNDDKIKKKNPMGLCGPTADHPAWNSRKMTLDSP